MDCRFAVGDRIVFIYDIDPDGCITKGMTGTVCDIDDFEVNEYVGVHWDHYNDRMHNCSGFCPDGYGWNVPSDMIDIFCSDLDLSSDDVSCMLQMVVTGG